MNKISILFICLGNICRSPMAEAIMRKMVNLSGLGNLIVVDSAGTGDWHVGEPPHSGTQEVLRRHDVPLNGMRARQIEPSDLHEYDYLVVMDNNNLRDVNRLTRHYGASGKVVRLLDYADADAVGSATGVPDPYFQGGFEHVYTLVKAGCAGLLAAVRVEHRLNGDGTPRV